MQSCRGLRLDACQSHGNARAAKPKRARGRGRITTRDAKKRSALLHGQASCSFPPLVVATVDDENNEGIAEKLNSRGILTNRPIGAELEDTWLQDTT